MSKDIEIPMESACAQQNGKDHEIKILMEDEDDREQGEKQTDNLKSDEADGHMNNDVNPTEQSNLYTSNKSLAQGMMDIALLTANANQLRYIIEYNSSSKTYYLNLVLIGLSLIIQVAVGVSLILKGRFKGKSKKKNKQKFRNNIVVGIFFVTLINVLIAGFTITTPAPSNTLIAK